MIKDKMTPKERMAAPLQNKDIDRMPIMLLCGSVSPKVVNMTLK